MVDEDSSSREPLSALCMKGVVFFYILCGSAVFAALPVFGPGLVTNTSLSWILPTWIALSLIAASGAKVVKIFPCWSYFSWVMLLVVHQLLFPSVEGFQRFVMIINPLLVGFVASSMQFDAHEFSRVDRALKVTAICLLTIRIGATLFDLEINVAGMVMSAVLLISYFTFMFVEVKGRYGVWVLISLLIPVIGVNRMAVLAGLVAIVLSLASIKRRQRVALLAVGLIGAVVVFNQEAFQGKMFYSGHGTIATLVDNPSDIRTHGRLVMWLPLWSEILNRPVLGHGFDASTKFIMDFIPWIRHPHNDYLRIAYDLGFVGLAVFLAAIVSHMRSLVKLGRTARWEARVLLLVGASVFVPFLFLMLTGNPILYVSYFGNLQYGLIGLGYALVRRDRRDVGWQRVAKNSNAISGTV